MRWLIAHALRARVGIAVLVLLGLVIGALALRHAPYDVLPDFVPPQVTVQTEAPGLDPGQVEQLVTRPIEAALNGAQGLATMRSQSIAGLSVVTLDFLDGSDPYRVRQGVAEKLADALPQLPAGVGAPKLSPLTSATMDVLKLGLVSDRVPPMALRDYADWVLKPALLAVPGAARITVFGGEVREVAVAVRPERLLAYRLAASDVLDALRRALAAHGAGYIESGAQRLEVRVPLPSSAATLAATPLAVRGARPLTVGDVADVRVAPAPLYGDALIMGRPGILLTISGQYGANTLAVTRALEARLAELAPGMRARGIMLYPQLHRPASFILTALGNLRDALLLGAAFVAAVLLLFLRDWRAALVSFVAIPLSLLAAAPLLVWAGVSLNVMTLGGFAVALGVLVDDAIIDVENILRRLRSAGDALELRTRLAVVLEASIEIRSAMVYATVVVLLVFVPVLLQSGVTGRFIAPLAWAFILSVLASLAVAIVVTPALATLLLARGAPRAEPRWLPRLRAAQAATIVRLARRPWRALALLLVAFVVVAALALRVPAQLLPDFRESHFVVQVSARQPGMARGEMLRLGEALSARLRALPQVATVEEQIGRSELGEDTWTVDRGELHVELKHDPSIDQAAAQAAIRDVLEDFPSLQSEVVTFIGDRLSETLTGETTQVAVQLYGDDLDALDRAAQQARAALATVPGVVDLQSSAGTRAPGYRLQADAAALTAYGVDPQLPATLLATATLGLPAGDLYVGDRTVPVVLRLALPPQHVAAELERQLVPTAADGYVPFARIATLVPEDARPQIRHEGGRRYAVVGFDVQGRGIDAVIADARAALTRAGLPAGVDVAFGGVGTEQQTAARRLWLASAATLVLIVLVLASAFRERRHAALVLLNLPFALLGALAALLLSRQALSIGAAVGLVTVFGISARNAILLLAHYEQLETETGARFDLALAQRGAAERLVPVLMTALVAALGLLPLALGLGRAGYEIEAPLAIVVLGGLVTSTALSLLLLPALAARWLGARD